MSRSFRLIPVVSGRSRWCRCTVIICTVIIASAVFCCWFNPIAARAEDEKEVGAPTQNETDPDYVVPDGTPKEILKFIDDLKARKVKFANRREGVDHAIKIHRACIVAGDKILGQETDAKVAASAARLKLTSLTILAANEIGDAGKEAMAAVSKLRMDERKEVSKVADQFWNPIRIVNVADLAAADRKELTDEVIASVSKSGFSRETTGEATQLGDALADKGHAEEAGELFDRLSKLAKDSDDSDTRDSAERFEGIARRVRLPGHFMALEGKVLNGENFDWASYRGKVVLVDFWATWCGPCVAELPNVMKNYEKYHDKGFDVVGISLDRSREALDKFIEKKEIPWVQLYDEEIQKGKGWNHPMAQHFGIQAIPATVLIDKDGKVVSLQARGPELSKLLEKMIGDAE